MKNELAWRVMLRRLLGRLYLYYAWMLLAQLDTIERLIKYISQYLSVSTALSNSDREWSLFSQRIPTKMNGALLSSRAATSDGVIILILHSRRSHENSQNIVDIYHSLIEQIFFDILRKLLLCYWGIHPPIVACFENSFGEVHDGLFVAELYFFGDFALEDEGKRRSHTQEQYSLRSK